MLILKDRKRVEGSEVFKENGDLLNHLKIINDKINFDNLEIINKVNGIYNKIINEDGVIKWVRFDKWLPKEFNFKYKNILQKEFWLERGWSEKETINIISKIMVERSNKAIKTKLNIKNKIIFGDKKYKIVFKGGEFISSEHPKCNICDNKLLLNKKNINNVIDDFYYEIKKCSNKTCDSHKSTKNEKYKHFLPKEIANNKIKELKDILKKTNRLSKESWINKGYSENKAIKKISEMQSEASKQVKNRFIISKVNLSENGFSDEEIKRITLTPTNVEFWLNKGYSENEAIDIIIKNQVYATQFIDYDKRLLPSNIQYWINKGDSYNTAKEKVTQRQTTFSKEICIKKYGEIKGLDIWKKRQEKWLKNYSRANFSKISQELFWGIMGKYKSNTDEIYFATYKDGVLDDSGKNNEYRLNVGESYILPDFFIKNKGKIIEFDGTYYHRNTSENLIREGFRDANIINSGYEVLHVTEKNYKENKQEIINKCLAYLSKK